jgi:exodeoxyribonuclease VII large subunit
VAAARRRLDTARSGLASLERALSAVSPQRTLERGYAIVATGDGAIVRSVGAVTAGQRISVRVADGEFGAEVSRD